MAALITQQSPAATRAALVAHCALKFGIGEDAVERFVAPLTNADIAAGLRLGVEDCLRAVALRRCRRLTASAPIPAALEVTLA